MYNNNRTTSGDIKISTFAFDSAVYIDSDNEKNQSGSVDDQSKNNDDLQSGSESYISVDESTPKTTNEAVETPDTAKTEETKQEDKKDLCNMTLNE